MSCAVTAWIWAIVCPACEIVVGTVTTLTRKVPAHRMRCVCGTAFEMRAPNDKAPLRLIARPGTDDGTSPRD